VYVVLLERDKKYNYSYNDKSGKQETCRGVPMTDDRKHSAKKKKGDDCLVV